MNETTRVTTAEWSFDFDQVGQSITIQDDPRPHTIVRVESPYCVVLVPRRWWHRFRLLRWAFFEPNSMEDTR